jgi:hypothetical protein
MATEANDRQDVTIAFQGATKYLRLSASEKWAKAISSGELSPDTLIEVTRNGIVRASRAGELPELARYFAHELDEASIAVGKTRHGNPANAAGPPAPPRQLPTVTAESLETALASSGSYRPAPVLPPSAADNLSEASGAPSVPPRTKASYVVGAFAGGLVIGAALTVLVVVGLQTHQRQAASVRGPVSVGPSSNAQLDTRGMDPQGQRSSKSERGAGTEAKLEEGRIARKRLAEAKKPEERQRLDEVAPPLPNAAPPLPNTSAPRPPAIKVTRPRPSAGFSLPTLPQSATLPRNDLGSPPRRQPRAAQRRTTGLPSLPCCLNSQRSNPRIAPVAPAPCTAAEPCASPDLPQTVVPDTVRSPAPYAV